MLNAQPRSSEGNVVIFANRPHSSPLEHSSPAAKLWRPAAAEARRLTLNDPAVLVATDFTREAPVTVTEDRPIDEALRDMIIAGVRALLVIHGDLVSGLITSYDIQGERPLKFLRATSYTRHDEIEVGHVMTPWDRVLRVNWPWIARARVHEIVELFRRTDATHLVVVENVEHRGVFVRALISRARVARQLGYSFD
jgi:DeoR family transcriptional regulator, catabolite repression regulator